MTYDVIKNTAAVYVQMHFILLNSESLYTFWWSQEQFLKWTANVENILTPLKSFATLKYTKIVPQYSIRRN